MANIAQSVNVISPLMTTKNGIVKQTTWWPLYLFSRFMHGWTVGTHVACSSYTGETEPRWMRGIVDTPWLDVSATLDDEGCVNMVVVNVHMTQAFEVELEGLSLAENSKVLVWTVTADKWDAVNTAEKSMVELKGSNWDGRGKFTFADKSITLLRWRSG